MSDEREVDMWNVKVIGFAMMLIMAVGTSAAAEDPAALAEVKVNSSIDGAPQTVRYWAPPSLTAPAPLLVFLHSWSADVRANYPEWVKEATDRGWVNVQPDFRGPNSRPEACGSPQAQQDVLDAVDWACSRFPIDRGRIYLAGASGGGHMTLLMAGRNPDRFSAVSAYVPITDLAEWYRFHSRTGTPGRYAEMTAASCGGAPGKSAEVDEQYRLRSPITWIAGVGDLPVDIAAGVHDGKTGSVPIRHSINAFNVLAKSRGDALISAEELLQLETSSKLDTPSAVDVAADKSFDRAILLRRSSGPSRVTIFEGGHEGLPVPSCAWLSRQQRMTKTAPSSGKSSPAGEPSTPTR